MIPGLERAHRLAAAASRGSSPEPLGARLLSSEPVERMEVSWRIAARSRNRIVVLSAAEVWAFEARNRLCFVHSTRGKFDIDTSLREIEASSLGSEFLRVHRNWLANTKHVRELELRGKTCCLSLGAFGGGENGGLRVPVSREAASRVRERLLEKTVGLRTRRSS